MWGALAAWAAFAAFLARRFAGLALDDFFITYRYALHLASGQGFVFNVGEKVFGLTNPGLALALAAGYRITGVAIPCLATMLFAASLVALAAALVWGCRRTGRLPEALGGGSLLVTSSFLWVLQGGEAIPMLALLVCAAELCVAWPAAAGLLAGTAVWFRPEGALGVAFLCLLAWRETRRIPWRFAAMAALVVAAGVAAAGWYFGSPIPNSLAAKHAMAAGVAGAWSGPLHVGRLSAQLLARHFGCLWQIVAALGVAGQVPLFARGGRAGQLLVLLGLALAIFYPLSGVPWFPWYMVPSVVALLCGVPFLVGAVVRQLARMPNRPRVAVAALVGCLLAAPVFVSLLPAACHRFRIFEWPPFMERYRLAGLWLARNAPTAATVSYYEVGALGYFSDRTVIDILGIVTPEVLPYVRRGDMAGAFLCRPADYVVFDADRGGWMPVAAPWFRRAYRPVTAFGELTLFARRPEVPLPAPAPAREPGDQVGSVSSRAP